MNTAHGWIVLALAGCGQSNGQVDVDVGQETAADATPEPDSFGPDASSSRDVECGLASDGTYLGPCNLALTDGARSTLCDEVRATCIPPVMECDGGWCRVPAASFVSGLSLDSRIDRTSRDTAISVVRHSFRVAETEVTVGEFAKVMGYAPPMQWGCGSDCPVLNVSIFETLEYANRLGAAEGLPPCYTLDDCDFETMGQGSTWNCSYAEDAGPTCLGIRLPSRMEWELAARAGSPFCASTGPFNDPAIFETDCNEREPFASLAVSCGGAYADYTPCQDFSGAGGFACAGTQIVGRLRRNPLGLYDVHGNALELTTTVWDTRPEHADRGPPLRVEVDSEDGRTIHNGELLYSMGGSWREGTAIVCAEYCDPYVVHSAVFDDNFNVGFRVVQTVPE